MTVEEFEKVKELKDKIDRLYDESYYLYKNDLIHNRKYNFFYIYGATDDGNFKLFEVSEELLEAMKDWYSDNIQSLEKEFEGI
jgi:hypothetical protein